MATLSAALATAFAHHQAGRLDLAGEIYRRVLAVEPDQPDAWHLLGMIALECGQPAAAIEQIGHAVAVAPGTATYHRSLGDAYRAAQQLAAAVACYRRALRAKPGFVHARCNLIYTLHFSPEYSVATIDDELRQFHRDYVEPLAHRVQPHTNDRSPDRRLRIGYVSPNFCDHVVGRNLLPLLREHNHQEFELFCYADLPRPDAFTERLRACADGWRKTDELTDQRLGELIHDDQIDILVDLTLHLADNRLLVFARKPAPVQVTFAGYPGSTGLSTIDDRLTDPYLDPPGLHDACYSEASIRLPDTFWCYDPLSDEPPVSVLPALTKGFVTFGCLNNFCKINAPVLKLWGRVLNCVDRSRLVILSAEGSHRQATLDLLAQENLAADRVAFVTGRYRSEYLKLYHDIDIGLDTFPYNGHTTSLDSFWMGVPVVTLIGQTAVGRAGWSQLTNLGLSELAADTADRFVILAVGLANDPPRLARLRATLRDRMQTSPLTDAPRFARNVEAAYRTMWQRWCAE